MCSYNNLKVLCVNLKFMLQSPRPAGRGGAIAMLLVLLVLSLPK